MININTNILKYIGVTALVIVIFGGAFYFKKTEVAAPINGGEVTDPREGETNTPTTPEVTAPTNNLSTSQNILLKKLEQTVKDKDFENFALTLEEVYKNQWGGKKEFSTVESSMYVYATNEYWVKGDLENSLRVSDIVYGKVPEAWRFRYLRIVTLEKYGRNAFNSGDLVKAEEYANKILQMMYRPEGANLMADIYIAKIEQNIRDGKTDLAKQNLGFIWGFEVSADRAAKFEALKAQLGL